MVHRALWGSVERFFGILIEHYAGAFPLWLAPVQVASARSAKKSPSTPNKSPRRSSATACACHLDDRNEKLHAKIRDAEMQKIPYMLVIGGKEAEAGTVSVRHRSKGDLGPKPLPEVIDALKQEVESKSQ